MRKSYDNFMRFRAEMFNKAKTDEERARINSEAYACAFDLAGAVAKSGISREMEKLRLIKRYEYFRDGMPNEACSRRETATKPIPPTDKSVGILGVIL